jgi:hypothetical protein
MNGKRCVRFVKLVCENTHRFDAEVNMVVGSSGALTYVQYSRQSSQIASQSNEIQRNNQNAQADTIVRHSMSSRVKNEQTILDSRQWSATRGNVLDMTA